MKAIFECRSFFPVSVESLFQFHEDKVGFDTLVGLDKNVKVIQRPENILVGAKAIMEIKIAPFIKQKWVAEHIEYEKNKLFVDKQVEGPFKSFVHYHKFESTKGGSILNDHIEFEFYINFISKYFVSEKIKSNFKERHKATAKYFTVDSNLEYCGLV
jgi:hypothetical protein